MINENGKKLENSLKILGLDVRFITETISTQIATYHFDFNDIRAYSKAKLDKVIEKLSLYYHRNFKTTKSNKAHFGIVMPNRQVAPLWLANLKQPEKENCIVVGRDLENKDVELDFNKISHLLIAGTTGSGKSVLLNSIIYTLYTNIKAENFILKIIDPKGTEFNIFKPLNNCEYIDETTDAIATLDYLVEEMNQRYRLMAEGNNDFLPIYVVVDELADLMLSSRYDVEENIVRLAQKSRACKIHLILATQRPTVNVITGLIKANMPNKICLKMVSQVDSRVMLDHKGAEQLLGRGDALLKLESSTEERRFQCAMISRSNLEKAINGGNNYGN